METDIKPRNNPYLIGHEQEEKVLLEAWRANSLHNSWLFCGVEGIGKSTLAYKFARFLLNEAELNKETTSSLDISPDSKIFHLVTNNSHPDLKIIERDYTDTEKRKIQKAIKSGEQLSDDELKDLKKSAFIRVDDVRTINEFMSKSASNDGWRVVIVDSVDELNNAGANAILKVLEEPPHQSILILISHNPNKLLPTILSRCAKLSFKPLQDNHVATLLRRYRPELSEAEIKELISFSGGSIGRAMTYADHKATDIYKKLCEIIYAKNSFSTADLLKFAADYSKDEDLFALGKEMILKFINENIKNTENVKELAASWDYAVKIFDECDRLNLDKKQTFVNIVYNIIKAI
ncbi:MAG: AAA family ATPase [Alphaproteobacteria bacterium]|nr:AAA family ATPase [Alphaproteobacteria bacterium]